MFTTMTFELASAPVGVSGAAGQQRSPLTLSRLVEKHSPVVFSASTGSTQAKDVVVDFLDGPVTILRARLTNAYVSRYAQYSTAYMNAHQVWEVISISYDQLSLVAQPVPSTLVPLLGVGGDLSVTGLCKAAMTFATMAFEIASSPAATPAREKRHFAPATLSRIVSSDSAEVFNACAGNIMLPEVTIFLQEASTSAVGGVGKLEVITITTLTNARVARYTQYGKGQLPGSRDYLLWEEISLEYDSISIKRPTNASSL